MPHQARKHTLTAAKHDYLRMSCHIPNGMMILQQSGIVYGLTDTQFPP